MMTTMISKIPTMRAQALELDADGNALLHRGKAKAIPKLKLPIDVTNPHRSNPALCYTLLHSFDGLEKLSTNKRASYQ